MSAVPASIGGTPDLTVPGYQGEAVPLRTLYYHRDDSMDAHLACSLDHMRAFLRVLPGPAWTGLTRETVVSLMAHSGITTGFVEAGILLFLNRQNGPSPFTGYFQVARGEPMRKGESASIEFHVQPTSLEPRYDQDDTGGIDFKQLNLIENCFTGQRVASIRPPGPGRPGRNIFGHEIPPVPGENILVQPGPGVVISSNGRDFSSEVEGRLVYEKGVLSVSPSLEIGHDIDYAVGNVDFVGKVTIRGSLLDGFYVNAKRGVELFGDVGAGRITSEGNVKITGGVKGKNAAIITCKNLTVHYLDDASVEASGDVVATKEIMNSNVKALGRVTVTSGAIIGGSVCGFQGVEADTLGSEMGVATAVMAGLNWTEENRKSEIRAKVAEYMDRLQSAKVLLEPLFAAKEMSAKLSTEQKTILADLVSELQLIRESLQELIDERARIEGRSQVGMLNQINVKKMLHMGVSTHFSAVEGQVKDAVKGPLSILQDERHKMHRITAYDDMPPAKSHTAIIMNAAKLEREAAAEKAEAERAAAEAAALAAAGASDAAADAPGTNTEKRIKARAAAGASDTAAAEAPGTNTEKRVKARAAAGKNGE